jgi:hypothetical protein
MLETVLRAGVLGEDDTGEESPKNLKIPSRKPSIVCENCLYSREGNGRVRAFHIMDPKGVLDMLIIFHEKQGSEVPLMYSSDDADVSSYISKCYSFKRSDNGMMLKIALFFCTRSPTVIE